jgi:hypothetical protein
MEVVGMDDLDGGHEPAVESSGHDDHLLRDPGVRVQLVEDAAGVAVPGLLKAWA